MAALKTKAEALEELGLSGAVSAEDIRAAFRQCLKQAHPDLNGDNDIRLRRLILARDLLFQNDRTSTQTSGLHHKFNIGNALQGVACPLTISLHQALFGGRIVIDVPALEFAEAGECPSSLIQTKKLHITLPAGLRDGETLRLACGASGTHRLFHIQVETDADCRLWGHDIWMTTRLENRFMRRGGQTVIDTPHGPLDIHLPPRTFSGSRLSLKGLGLPATATVPAGDLHIRLEACADRIRPADHVLTDFRQRWAS